MALTRCPVGELAYKLRKWAAIVHSHQRAVKILMPDNPIHETTELQTLEAPQGADPTETAVSGQDGNREKPAPAPRHILVIDLGGSKLKVLATGETEPRKSESGPEMTPVKMVEAVHQLAEGWQYEAVSLGYPGLCGASGPRSEPGNLAAGWVGFDFAAAFKVPVRILNDAAMQALGSYEGGRMLFLGLGTGLGSTLIAGNAIVPLELGGLRYTKTQKLGEVLGRQGLERIGKKAWRTAVAQVVHEFLIAFEVDYVVLGGGNSSEVKDLPAGARLGHNQTAFRGGFRLWNLDDVQTLSPEQTHEFPNVPMSFGWRIL